MLVRHCKLAGLVIAGSVLSSALVLADPGSYERMMKERMLNNVRSAPAWKGIPEAIKVRYSECFAATLVAGLSTGELKQMDAGTQGVHVDDQLAQKALDQLVAVIARLNNRDLSVLEKTCPDDIGAFEKAGL